MNKDYWMLLYNNPSIGIGFLLGVYTAIRYFFRFIKFLFSEKAKEDRYYKIINLEIFFLRLLIYRKVIWYFFLLIFSGTYSIVNWSKVSIFKPLTGDVIIFAVCIILALSPLFKKIGANDCYLELDLEAMRIEALSELLQKLIKKRDNKVKNNMPLSSEVTKDIESIKEQVMNLRKKEEGYNV